MELLGIIFQLIAAILGILASAILYWVNKDKRYGTSLLILLLLSLSLLNLNGALYYSRWLLYIPWWHKITQPFAMLVAPFAFLYTRSVLKSELVFQKKDFLFFIPFILVAINFLPYYLLPVEEKRNYLLDFYKSSALKSSESEGLLPEYSLAFFRVIWSFIFIFLNFRLLKQFKKTSSPKIISDNWQSLQWLKQLNSMLMAITLIALAASVMAPLIKNNYNMISLSLGSFVLIIVVNLFMRPKILYGIYDPVTRGSDKAFQQTNKTDDAINEIALNDVATTDPVFLSHTASSAYKKNIELFFEEKKPFLQANYSLEQLVADTKIPRNLLSACINKEYGMGFREFLNRYRVNYFIKHLHSSHWEHYTIEAKGLECGFSNKNTFFKNFKQITGQTPSEFLKSYSTHNEVVYQKREVGAAIVRFDTTSNMK